MHSSHNTCRSGKLFSGPTEEKPEKVCSKLVASDYIEKFRSSTNDTLRKIHGPWMLIPLLLIIQVLLLLTYLNFLPHYSVWFQGNTYSSRKEIATITEGLKTISYIAKDLSVTLNDVKSIFESSYLDTIDTLSEFNVYYFYPFKYCRYNLKDKSKYCLQRGGLDVATSLVADIGYQLGLVSKAHDPKVLSRSFETAYSHALLSMKELYDEQKRNGMIAENRKPLFKTVTSLLLSQRYAKWTANSACLILISHFLVFAAIVAAQILERYHETARREKSKNQVFFYVILISLFSTLGLILLHWIAELCYYSKLSNRIPDVQIASIQFRAGFTSLTLTVVCYTMVIFLFLSVS